MALTPEEIAEFEKRAQLEEFEQRARQEEAGKETGAGVSLPSNAAVASSVAGGALIGSRVGSAQDTAKLNKIGAPIPPVPGVGPGPVKPPPIQRPVFPPAPIKPTLQGVGSTPGVAPGQAWMAKTGYGAGPGYTVSDVVETQKAQNAPVGSGKITKTITGPLNVSGIMDQLSLQSQDQAGMDATRQKQAEHRANIQAQNAALLADYQKQKMAHAEAVNKLQREHAEAVRKQQESHNYDQKEFASRQSQHAEDVNARNQALHEQEIKKQQFNERPLHKTSKFRSGVIGALTGLATSPIVEQGVNYFLGNRDTEEHAEGGEVGHYDIGGGVKKIFTPIQTKFLKASEAYGPHEGKVLNLTQSDRLKAIEGELGGHEFSGHQLTKPEYAEAKATWGVASPQEATKIINRNKRVPEGKSIWAPLIGSETQHQTNPHVFDPMLEEFYRQVRLGNLPKETAEKMKMALAKQQFSTGPRKGQLMFPNTPNVTDEENIRNLAGTFENRGPLANILFNAQGAGKTKGQIIDYQGMLQDMADPKSIGVPTHSVGTRIFTLDNGVVYRPDLHSGFPHILTGNDTGVSHLPIPKQLALSPYIQQHRELTGREPGTWDFTRKPLSIEITDKLLRSWENAGHKEGGLINMASGGHTTPAWQRKEGKNPTGGLNAVGRASYNRETGGHLRAPQPEGGPRKDSFCARMGGNPGPMKDEHGKPTRKALALKKWKC